MTKLNRTVINHLLSLNSPFLPLADLFTGLFTYARESCLSRFQTIHVFLKPHLCYSISNDKQAGTKLSTGPNSMACSWLECEDCTYNLETGNVSAFVLACVVGWPCPAARLLLTSSHAPAWVFLREWNLLHLSHCSNSRTLHWSYTLMH